LNFWINFREAKFGDGSCGQYAKILELAEKLVDEKKCIFPITDSMFMEILKQDGAKLEETVSIVDLLSQGVCIEDRESRILFELIEFLDRRPNIERHTARELLWTKMYSVFHNQFPFHEEWDKDFEEIYQRNFVDWSWRKLFGDFVEMFKDFDDFGGIEFPDKSDELNEGKEAHKNEYKTFDQLFLNEVAGAIDIVKEQIATATVTVCEKIADATLTPEMESEIREKHDSNKVIYNIFRLKDAGRYLPYIRIMSSCHAAIRWNTTQKYDGNHTFDFEHAACALPYTDYFFCEKQLRHIVTQSSLSLVDLYDCQVISNLDEILNVLESISSA